VDELDVTVSSALAVSRHLVKSTLSVLVDRDHNVEIHF
jgi:hypothetical protein